ncbi:substrate-binding domain-containing protein [Pseudolysinimonas kribbensis]|uniref:substrate-binding domain-containing protein n=1 Tax=Pseudolysinimonas kribbensis TaxID=433641 RepID=UPI0024E15B8D|nr:substrate-binding domain-containing protein [Pseudolysinimonas kribbensis]
MGQNQVVERDLFRSATVERRVRGIRGRMDELGLAFVAEESCWEWEPDNGYDVTSRLLERRDDVRALLCMNDRLAFGAYQALSEHGLRAGSDVSVVSFDNDELAAYLRPGLTTVSLPHEEMGREAVRLLLAAAPEPGEYLVPMPLIERSSVVDTAPPSSASSG